MLSGLKNESNLSEYEKITAKIIMQISINININFLEKLLKLILFIFYIINKL